MLGLTILAIATAVATSTPAPASTVPFDLIDNRVIVQVRINGSGPFSMIVDTGAPGLVVTPEVAQLLHLKSKPSGFVNGAGSGQLRVALTKVADLRIGSVSFQNVGGEVLDLSPIRRAIGFPQKIGRASCRERVCLYV